MIMKKIFLKNLLRLTETLII